MKKIFKCKNLFLVTFLAIAGFFSAGAFVVNKQAEDTSVVEKAEATVTDDSGPGIRIVDTHDKGFCTLHIWNFNYGKTSTATASWDNTITRNYTTTEFETFLTNHYGSETSFTTYGEKMSSGGKWKKADDGSYYIQTYYKNYNKQLSDDDNTDRKTYNYVFPSWVKSFNFQYVGGGSDSERGDSYWWGGTYWVDATTGNPGDKYYRIICKGNNYGERRNGNTIDSRTFNSHSMYKEYAGDAAGSMDTDNAGIPYFYDPGIPTKKGFVFDSWYTDELCNNKYTLQMYTESTTLYAKFTVSTTQGWYAIGNEKFMTSIGTTGSVWTVASGLHLDTLPKATGTADNARKIAVNLQATSQFRIVYSSDGSTIDWLLSKQGSSTDGVSGVTTSASKNNIIIDTTNYYDLFVLNDSGNGTGLIDNKYSVKYKCVVNGVLQDQFDYNASKYSAISASSHTLFSELTPAELTGYDFQGWYTDSTLSNDISSTYVYWNSSDSDPVYAKYTTSSSTTRVYIAINGSNAQNKKLTYGSTWGTDTWGDATVYTCVASFANSTDLGTIKIKEYTAISVSGWKFFICPVPASATGFLIYNGVYWDNNKVNQTEDLTLTAGKNMFAIGSTQTTNQLRSGDWCSAVYSLEVGTSSSFGTKTTYDMEIPKDSNFTAAAYSITVNSNYYVRAHLVVSNGITLTTTYNKTKGGEDWNGSKSEYTTATDNGVKFTSTKTCNFFIGSEGNIWVEDCNGVSNGGYLYISTNKDISNFKIKCTYSSTTTLNNELLSRVSAVEKVDNLKFNDTVYGVIRISIYYLRGTQTPATNTQYSIVLTDVNSASEYCTINGVYVLTSSPSYYANISGNQMTSHSTITASSTIGPGAKLAYKVAKEISAADNKSVCSIDSDVASSIMTDYGNLNGTALSNFNNSYIKTWVNDSYTSETDYLMPSIMLQISRRAGNGSGSNNAISNIFPYSISAEDNTATILIIVASSISILSITALSVLMIKKRKSKEQ